MHPDKCTVTFKKEGKNYLVEKVYCRVALIDEIKRLHKTSFNKVKRPKREVDQMGLVRRKDDGNLMMLGEQNKPKTFPSNIVRL